MLSLKSAAVKVLREVLIVAAIVAVCFLGLEYYGTKRQGAQLTMKGPLTVIGSELAFPGSESVKRFPLFVLVASPTCSWCVKSAEFHARLAKEAKIADVPFFVFVPRVSEATEYLSTMQSNGAQVRDWGDLKSRVRSTPSLLAVDKDGIVARIWSGKVPSSIEEEVIQAVRLRSLDSIPRADRDASGRHIGPQELSVKDARELARSGSATILDVSDHQFASPIEGAKKIPLQEFQLRAEFELDRSKLHIVDCTMMETEPCESILHHLSTIQVKSAVIGMGTYRQSCDFSKVE
jgi:hypothetical protein